MTESYLSTDQKNLLSGEAAAGISFSNTIIAIGTALVGLAISNPPTILAPLLVFQGSILIVMNFFSSICYANTHGRLRRQEILEFEALKPIVWGNALSEYLGVYILILSIPTAIQSYTLDITLTRVTYSIILFGFGVYHLTEFDLLERVVGSKLGRFFVTILISVLVISCVEIAALKLENAALVIFILYMLTLIFLAVFHIFVSEKERI